MKFTKIIDHNKYIKFKFDLFIVDSKYMKLLDENDKPFRIKKGQYFVSIYTKYCIYCKYCDAMKAHALIRLAKNNNFSEYESLGIQYFIK